MLEHVWGGASPRKMRLFGCACVRREWGRLTAEGRLALWRVEALAEGSVPAEQAAAMEAAAAQFGSGGLGGVLARLFGPPNEWRHVATFLLPRVGWREELAAQCDLARCVFGNPFRPTPQAPA